MKYFKDEYTGRKMKYKKAKKALLEARLLFLRNGINIYSKEEWGEIRIEYLTLYQKEIKEAKRKR